MLLAILLTGTVYADSSYSHKWAILVGVSQYEYIGDLDFPGNDVEDMRSVLVNRCGIPSSHVFACKDSEATKSGIQNAISQVSSRSGSDDLVIFFFSGHGIPSGYLPDSGTLDELDGYEETLCPYDALPDSFSNDITDDEFQAWISAVPSKNTVCIIDTCGSGGMTKSAARGNLTRGPFLTPSTKITREDGFARDLTRDISGRKYLVLMSADDDEVSYEFEALQNGLFSYYLAEGITKTSANADLDPWISFEEAFAYARTGTTRYESSQHPQITDGNQGEEVEIYPLASSPTPTPTETTIIPTPTSTQSVGVLLADFSASITSGAAPLTVQFQDASKGDPAAWIWDIDGDSFPDYSEKNCEHTYTAPGLYSVSLSVTRNQEFNTVTRKNYIHVQSGPVTTAPTTTPTTPVPANLVISLYPGWNLVSTPNLLAEGHRTHGEVFSGIDHDGRATFRYNAESRTWIRMLPGDEIQPFRGMWVYSKAAAQVPLTFKPSGAGPPGAPLYPGWNAVGFSRVVAAPAREALQSVQSGWTKLFGYDGYSQAYEPVILKGGFGSHSDSIPVFPGRGYWVYMDGQGTLA